MFRKKQGRKSHQQPEASGPEFIGSLRSQKSVEAQWRFESDLKTAEAQVGLWEGNLKKAQAGVTRQSAQVSAGRGVSHAILQTYVKEVGEAEQMVTAFKSQVAGLQAQIDALMPDAAKAAERAEQQNILAGRVLARLELDRKLDAALETVRGILEYRKQMTSEMREAALALDFDRDVKLDDERFEALLRALPSDTALESQKWVTWSLGQEDDRMPCTIRGGNATLPETLASHNAFRSGDCVKLTKAEEAEIMRIIDSQAPPQPPRETAEMRRLLGPPEPVPDEKLQWVMLR